MPTPPKDIDSYIAGFPAEAQAAMQQIRSLVHQLVPEAEETISYGMPTFNLNGSYLVYFAGYKHHIGLYPAPVNAAEFQQDFAQYKTGKGSIQFPLNKPMPMDLIERIIRFRKKERTK